MSKKNIRWFLFIPAPFIWIYGIIFANRATKISSSVSWYFVLGVAIMDLAILYFEIVLHSEIKRIGYIPENKFIEKLVNKELLNMPETVEDFDDDSTMLSSYRKAFSDFFSTKGIEKNSDLQSMSSQILWHSLYLQKKRLTDLDLTMSMASERKDYGQNKRFCLYKYPFFDGRYDVKDMDEFIFATRTFKDKDTVIASFEDSEAAHYTVLSAKKQSEDEIICPGCGNVTTRQNLIDGCDYCSTKFTVEDLDRSVSSFSLIQNYRARNSKANNFFDQVTSWMGIVFVPFVVQLGFMMPFLYVNDINIIGRVVLSLICAVIFSYLSTFVLMPIFLLFIVPFTKWQRNLLEGKIIKRTEDIYKDEGKESRMVRSFDPLFSYKNFTSEVYNKLSAIHYADTQVQIEAFLDAQLGELLNSYKNIVNIDVEGFEIKSYSADDINQNIKAEAKLELFKYIDSKIVIQKETVDLMLQKSKECKTQAVCAPYVLRCSGCGNSISLLDGRHCTSCGKDIDMKSYDWVITDYSSTLGKITKKRH